jgi:glutamate-1-semialdehyde 2,1-aminomutase
MSQGAGIGSAGGTPDAVSGLLRWCEYNDVASLTAVMEANGEQVAAILLEPVMTGAGIIAADPEFFRAARELCDRCGALLIADEVVTLRLDIGGQQTALGVEADLTVLGKIIGGGLPVGATGGRAEVLELFDPRRPGFVGHSGTFNGNPLTAVAGAASLDLLPADEITRINGLGDRLATAFKGAIEQAEVDGTVTRAGSLVQLHFETGGPVRSYHDTNMGSALLSHVHRASLEEGLLFAARGLMCISTAMDEAVIDEAAASFSRALARVKDRQLTGVSA